MTAITTACLRRRGSATLAALATLVTACGKDGGGTSGPAPAATTTATTPAPTTTATTPAGDGGVVVVPDASPPLAIAKGDPCRGVPLPADQHFVAAGLCARVLASPPRISAIRQITFAPNGDLFGVTIYGDVLLLHDADGSGDFEAAEIHDFAATGDNGNNPHLSDGFLYVGSQTGVKRWPYVAGATSGGAAQDVVVGAPGDGGHPLHTVHVYGGYLYVHSGSSGNADSPLGQQYDTNRSLLRRFKLSGFVPGTPFTWASGENVTLGLRNMVGFTQNAAGRMFGVVNGLDGASYLGADVSQDNPGEQVVELGLGKTYGYPFCFTAQRVPKPGGGFFAPGTQLAVEALEGAVTPKTDAFCAVSSLAPATFLQAHTAPLDILFFDTQPKGVLPERWRGGAFVTMHGSSSRAVPSGYKVVWIPFDANGKPPMPAIDAAGTVTFPYETVFGGGSTSGAVDGKWTWSTGNDGESPRPVGLAISPIDGALYVSSDAGHLYRLGQIGSGK